VVTGPPSDECDAVDDLIDTVPTTLAGLLSFLIYLAKAHRRDPDAFVDQHVEPLLETLGKVAAALSETLKRTPPVLRVQAGERP
jgi:hypothetical protein